MNIILRDFLIQCDGTIQACKPDLVLVDKRKKEAIIVDVAVPKERLVAEREIDKVTVVPIVIGTGTCQTLVWHFSRWKRLIGCETIVFLIKHSCFYLKIDIAIKTQGFVLYCLSDIDQSEMSVPPSLSGCPGVDFPKPNRGTYRPDKFSYSTNDTVTITCKYAAKDNADEVTSTCNSDGTWHPAIPNLGANPILVGCGSDSQ
eukprot:sb/3470616/